MNQRYESKETDVTGSGYEFVGNKRQNAGTLDQYVDRKHKREKKYLDFVLNPDIEAPIRMPSDFTYPTNILSYKQNFTLTLPTGDFVGFYAPQNHMLAPSGATTNSTVSYMFLARNTTAINYQAASYLVQSTTNIANFTNNAIDASQRFPYTANFDSARVIGGCCKIEYIGSLQDTSGVITIGANLIPSNALAVGNQIPPTNSQLFNLLLFKKFQAADQTKSTWFPVDPSVQNFVSVSTTATQTDAADFSQLAFYFNGYGLPANTQLDITIETYYEAVPNVLFSNLFVSSQGTSNEKAAEAWNEILDVGKKNMGQILITGARAAADWIGGPVGKFANKALDWIGG
jgi:hypothetical protein